MDSLDFLFSRQSSYGAVSQTYITTLVILPMADSLVFFLSRNSGYGAVKEIQRATNGGLAASIFVSRGTAAARLRTNVRG